MTLPISALSGGASTSNDMTVVSPTSKVVQPTDADAGVMDQMGYGQDLKRGFSGLMAFTFCFTVVSVFPSLSIGLDFGLNTGGSGRLLFFFIMLVSSNCD